MPLDRTHYLRWSERRKRRLIMASLTKNRYCAAFEPACGFGLLTAMLSQRCDSVLAMDQDHASVQAARVASAGDDNARIVVGRVPEDWPTHRRFDLIVLCEFLYYLSDADRSALYARLASSVVADADIVACHWRHPIPESTLTGDDMHAEIGATLGFSPVFETADVDFRLTVFRSTPHGVATREGLFP